MADGRGQFQSNIWADLKKAGGLAYSQEQIEIFLNGGDEMFSREQLTERIVSYFLSCQRVQESENGELENVWVRNPTKTGLALAIGVSNQTLCDYVNGINSVGNPYKTNHPTGNSRVNPNDFDLVRKAFQLIETFYEERLGDNRNNAGTIFWLNNSKNKQWSNEQEFKFSNKMEQVEALTAADLPKLSLQDDGCFNLNKELEEYSNE